MPCCLQRRTGCCLDSAADYLSSPSAPVPFSLYVWRKTAKKKSDGHIFPSKGVRADKDVVISKYFTSEFYHVSQSGTNVEKAVFPLKWAFVWSSISRLDLWLKDCWMASADICWLNSDTDINSQRGQHSYQIELKEALVTFTKKTPKKLEKNRYEWWNIDRGGTNYISICFSTLVVNCDKSA